MKNPFLCLRHSLLGQRTALVRETASGSATGESENQIQTEQTTDSVYDDFRTNFPPNLRTKDGHQVRFRAEVIIDNALYDYGLAHAHERKLSIEGMFILIFIYLQRMEEKLFTLNFGFLRMNQNMQNGKR